MVLPQSRAQTYIMTSGVMTFQDLAVRSHSLGQLWLQSFRWFWDMNFKNSVFWFQWLRWTVSAQAGDFTLFAVEPVSLCFIPVQQNVNLQMSKIAGVAVLVPRCPQPWNLVAAYCSGGFESERCFLQLPACFPALCFGSLCEVKGPFARAETWLKLRCFSVQRRSVQARRCAKDLY